MPTIFDEDPSYDTDLAYERASAAADDYPVDQAQEDAEFEAGAEDLDLRALRLEAEDEARKEAAMEADWENTQAQDAYNDYLDTTVDRGADPSTVLTFEEFVLRPVLVSQGPRIPEALPSAPEDEDDIPF